MGRDRQHTPPTLRLKKNQLCKKQTEDTWLSSDWCAMTRPGTNWKCGECDLVCPAVCVQGGSVLHL